MTNDEEIDRLRDLAAKMLVMLIDLDNGWPWHELAHNIEDIKLEAADLKVLP